MKATRISTNLFGEIIYFLINEETNEAIVVDPGMMKENECTQFDDAVKKLGITIKAVLLTHIHLDHAYGADYVKKLYGAEIYAHPADAQLGLKLEMQSVKFHIQCMPVEPLVADHDVNDGDHLSIAGIGIDVLATPGHTPGGVCYYIPDSGLAMVGDTIFEGSIGRTDIDGGNLDTLLKSIKDKIFTLPADTLLCPGHGNVTTVKDEISGNPYVQM